MCNYTVQTKYTKGLAVKNKQFYIDFVHWKNTFFPIAVLLPIRIVVKCFHAKIDS